MKTSISFKPSTAFSVARKLAKSGKTVAKICNDVTVHAHSRQHVTIVVKGMGKVVVKRNNKGVVINGVQKGRDAVHKVFSFGFDVPVLTVENEQQEGDTMGFSFPFYRKREVLSELHHNRLTSSVPVKITPIAATLTRTSITRKPTTQPVLLQA